MTGKVSIREAAQLLRLTRARVYQLIWSGELQQAGRAAVTLESVCRRAFRLDGDVVTYLPLEWQFRLHRPAPSWWPICGAQKLDRSAAVTSDHVPAELRATPELAAKIARLALDWAVP